MIAIVHSIYSQSVHTPALDAGLMDNDAERYCITKNIYFIQEKSVNINKTVRCKIFSEVLLIDAL